MDAKTKLATSKSDADRDYWSNRCDHLESQINNTVYSLYNLTPDEIELVEAS